MLVVKASMSNSYEVVPDNWGKQIGTAEKPCVFQPLPIARVPIGYGRDDEQARELAEWIADKLDRVILEQGWTERQLTTLFGIRFQPETTAVGWTEIQT